MTHLSSPTLPSGLPNADPQALQHSRLVSQHLIEHIRNSPHGAIPFEQWMNLALYAPGLGYYASGSEKFVGIEPAGDFATAPEMTPVFGQVLARQIAEILHASDA